MKEVKGNILDMTEGIVCHQTNCRKVEGAGLALAIRNQYPEWYKHFLTVDGILGHVDLFAVTPTLWIASLYAQDGYGRGCRVYTSYPAFDFCLSSLKKEISAKGMPNKVHFPHGIGCGLAGGDWDTIFVKIALYFPDASIVQLWAKGIEGPRGIEGVKGMEGVNIRGGDYEVDARGDWKCKSETKGVNSK
jgi:hypothetical protein